MVKQSSDLAEGTEGELNEARRVLNSYDCPCGRVWQDTWSCACDDRCPKCHRSCSPSKSKEIK